MRIFGRTGFPAPSRGEGMIACRLGFQRAACALLIGMFALVAGQGVARAETTALAAKLETLLKESGYKSLTRVNDAVWTLDFNGKRLAKFRIIVTLSEKEASGIIVAFANPVSKGAVAQEQREAFDDAAERELRFRLCEGRDRQ